MKKNTSKPVRGPKKTMIPLFYLLVFFGVVFSCVPVATLYCASGPNPGGTLTFGVENDFRGFDPLKLNAHSICGAIANRTIHEPLFSMDSKGELVPVLGLLAMPEEDGKTWTITLRQGVTFHDGTPFNADAVVYNWQRLLNPDNKFRGRFSIAPVLSVEKIDTFTVRFHLAHKWLPFPKILTDPRALYCYMISPKALENGTQSRVPVGTGPFMFEQWQTGDRFSVVKNPNYWQKGKPYLNRIVFKPVPDHQTRFASLVSGQVDMIFMDRGHLIQRAREDKALTVIQGDSNGAEIALLNTTKPPLDNPLVRRAIAHAWNQAAYVKMSYKDAIPLAYHPLGRSMPCGDAGYRAYNVKKAAALIAEYKKPVEIECIHTNTKRGQEFGLMLQQFCKEIGIKVSIKGLDVAAIVKKVFSKDFHVSSWRIPPMTDFGPYLQKYFYSKSPINASGYNNPEMDMLLTDQQTQTDPQKRQETLCRIVSLLNKDVPLLYRGRRRIHLIARPGISGIPEIRNGAVDISMAWIENQGAN